MEWASFEPSHKLAKGMFVAQVIGRSMEPMIPDGAYCLFRQVARPSSPERIVLVRHGGNADPETGGQYTVKFYREEKPPKGKPRIVLKPQNPEFAELVIPQPEADQVRVIAEVVEVLRG